MKTRQVDAAFRIQCLDAFHRTDDFRDAAGMKDLGIQMMAVAVVAQVEANDVETVIQQQLPERQDVQRLRTPLPAVQQHGEAFRRRPSDALLRRFMREQPDAVAAIEQQGPGSVDELATTPLDAGAPERQAGKHRLGVRVCQPGGWSEITRLLERSIEGHGLRGSQARPRVIARAPDPGRVSRKRQPTICDGVR